MTVRERGQVYRTIAAENVYLNGTAEDRRQTILGTEITSCPSPTGGHRPIVVQAPLEFCGAQNYPIYLFIRHRAGLHLVLNAGGSAFVIGTSHNLGMYDVAAYWHMGVSGNKLGIYRWIGTRYAGLRSLSA